QERRSVEMTDAQRLEIGRDGGGSVEGEVLGQLHTIGGARNGRRHGVTLRSQRKPTTAAARRADRPPKWLAIRKRGQAVATAKRWKGWQGGTGSCRSPATAPSTN